MDEPIRHFYSVAGFNTADISRWVIGNKYVAVMLKSGHIGVCATLGNEMSEDLFRNGSPDLNNTSHRIILNAYYNALFNYERQYTDIKDIFERIDFSRHTKIVMVGYFETLYAKFSGNRLPVYPKKILSLSQWGGIQPRLWVWERSIFSIAIRRLSWPF